MLAIISLWGTTGIVLAPCLLSLGERSLPLSPTLGVPTLSYILMPKVSGGQALQSLFGSI